METNGSIRKKLLPIVIFPIILLSCLITVTGVTLFYGFYTQSIRNELVSTTDTLLDCLNFAISGDYRYENEMLLKGDLNITDSTMLLRIKEQSQIDTTFFWDDLRIMTTIEDEYGVSAVGTKAGNEVKKVVLKQGQRYFSKDLTINGDMYIGYYVPLKNTDGEVVGMIFAGKQKDLVYEKITEVIMWFAVFSVIMIVVSIIITLKFSSSMIADINSINRFLKAISEGNLRSTLGNRVVNRNDEIGSIGLYALKMRDNLQKLIERDALTELYNRRSGHTMLSAISQKNELYCVVMCDIDFFKKVNDTYGHDAGDYVLQQVSRLIKMNVSDYGFASRWGGEEFLLVTRGSKEDCLARLNEIRNRIINLRIRYSNTTIKVTMTFGFVDCMEILEHTELINPSVNIDALVQIADSRLYYGKENGKNTIVCTNVKAAEAVM